MNLDTIFERLSAFDSQDGLLKIDDDHHARSKCLPVYSMRIERAPRLSCGATMPNRTWSQ
jgi:hypothetical protein